MNYDALSIDELDALSIELKAEIEALRERRRAIRLARDLKVEAAHIAAAIARAGLDGVVAVPGPAELRARLGRTAAGEVE